MTWSSPSNHAPHFALFGLDPDKQWDVLAEKYELLRRLWSEEDVTWSGRYRDAITGLTTQPRPFQRHIRVWHGSATSRDSTELAARSGDPLYSANWFFRTHVYQELIDHYRERWAPRTVRLRHSPRTSPQLPRFAVGLTVR